MKPDPLAKPAPWPCALCFADIAHNGAAPLVPNSINESTLCLFALQVSVLTQKVFCHLPTLTLSCASTGPASHLSTVYATLTPVSAMPSCTARCTGAAPRYLGVGKCVGKKCEKMQEAVKFSVAVNQLLNGADVCVRHDRPTVK